MQHEVVIENYILYIDPSFFVPNMDCTSMYNKIKA